ncbi:MAG: hypothetical protein U0271_22805 [Polyangiaceae bacterium]
MSRPNLLLPALLCALATGCPDAVPGTPHGGGGGAGGTASAGAGGAGGAIGPIDFRSAVSSDLPSPGEDFNDQYGFSVAASADTVVVGAYRDYASLIIGGAAHVFVWNGESYALETSLRASPAVGDSMFGWSVAIDGDRAVVGARGLSDPKEVAGGAYFLTRNGSSWVSQQLLQEDPPQTYGNFGRAVAVSGTRAIVSAPDMTARVFAFESSGSTWAPAGELVASDPAEAFGWAVALDGDTALVGSDAITPTPASAYIFVHDGNNWTEGDTLRPGAGGEGFGYAVSLSGDAAIVGTKPGNGPGGAFVFERANETWMQTAALSSGETVDGDDFGAAVAIHGDFALVGAPNHDDVAGADSGAAYIFVRTEGTWALHTKLVDPDPHAGDHFGLSVALEDGVAVVGGVQTAAGRGRVTVFRAR